MSRTRSLFSDTGHQHGKTLTSIIDDLIMDATDADVYGVPNWGALEREALRRAKQSGLQVTEQEVHLAVQQAMGE